jgi:ribosomal protein S8
MAFPNDGKRFQSGESGNPNGRPRKLPELDVILADVLSEEQNGISAAMAILLAVRSKAVKGDIRAAEVLLDRGYGKPKQTIDNKITTNEPLVIVLTEERKEDAV